MSNESFQSIWWEQALFLVCYFPHRHELINILCWILKGDLPQIRGVLSLCSFLLLSHHTCANSSCLRFHRFLASSLQCRKWVELCLGSSSLCLNLETLMVGRGNGRAHLVYFPSLRDHCPLWPHVQGLENNHFMYLVCFVVVFLISRRGKSNPFYSIFARSRSLKSFISSVSAL